MGKKTVQVFGYPYLVPAEDAKNCLEQDKGRGTIVAIEVKPSKNSHRASAKVQFTKSIYAKMIINLAKTKRLHYDDYNYLKAWESDIDIVQNPGLYVHEMEQVTLNFGCQISRRKFLVLWEGISDSVKFGTALKKMNFFLRHNSVEYKLQLSYECIWQIVLYPRPRQTTSFLLIQLSGAPRIYKKVGDSVYSYFREVKEDQWVRTTDFTPFSCIGQASGLCLQLPSGTKPPNFRDNFAYYKESENPFYLWRGDSFSHNLSLVPIVHPPDGLELPYKILFKVCRLVQAGYLQAPS